MFGILKSIFATRPKIDLSELRKRGVLEIDVRTPEEFQSGHAPGSINIPLDNFPSAVLSLDKTQPIIVCCASGMRSANAKIFLEKKGFPEVYNVGCWQNLSHN